MFKKMSLLIVIVMTAWMPPAHAALLGTEHTSGLERTYSHIIPFVSYYEKAALPPRLIAVFHVDCSEGFTGIVRHDQYDPRSQSVVIYLGGQIRDLRNECQGSLRKVEVDAGPTYSGQRFQVRQILSVPQPRG